MSASGLRRALRLGEGGSEALRWGSALAVALAAHAAVGLAWLTRTPDGEAPEQLPAVIFDLALSAMPGGAGEAPPQPAPQVAPPEGPADTPAVEAGAAPPSVAASAPLRKSPSPVARPVVSPKPSARHEPSPAEEARKQAEARRKAEAARERAEEIRRRAAALRQEQAAGASRPGPADPAFASVGAAAASAAWRARIVGILRSRFAGGAAGMASVTFSVAPGGRIAGARLTVSSGDPRLDAAALAAFRGPVPPPPAGYAGPLTFHIRLGVR